MARPLRGGVRAGARSPGALRSPVFISVTSVVALVIVGWGVWAAIDAYQSNAILSGLTADTTPIDLTIGNQSLTIPANMIRSRKARRGGEIDRVDLALLWPTMSGFTEDKAEVFKEAVPEAPIVYATIAVRDSPLDATGRLDSVYARFFVGQVVPGENGLVGRQLSANSGYGGEVIFFTPGEERPFVARCMATETPEMPATCLRDVNVGANLSLLYRFNRNLLPQWATLDAAMTGMMAGFLGR